MALLFLFRIYPFTKYLFILYLVMHECRYLAYDYVYIT